MRVCGVQGVSLIDFPGKISSVLFLGGCNFRCPFCQNPELVLSPELQPDLELDDVFASLQKKEGFIDGVVVTGGEPLVSGAPVVALLKRLHDMGLAVKLDTNGYAVETLVEVLGAGIVDYVAMDVKTSFEKYPLASGVAGMDSSRIERSIELLKRSGVPHEFRTTCVPGIVSKSDVVGIAQHLGKSEHYFLQQYRPGPDVIDPAYAEVKPYSVTELQFMAEAARLYVSSVTVRGV
ncbi:MAG: anaerobic ribonucleoside-triphosphate reductase activating protein [Dehalococcoidia bacterium]|nr:anaerobic ribonucleoside-triphosphate reductase activating protein [Dehalococcoidia bacterium]